MSENTSIMENKEIKETGIGSDMVLRSGNMKKGQKNGQEMLVKRIEYLCVEKGISQYKLALKSTVPVTTLDNIMKRRTVNPGLFTVVKLCNGLGITLAEFFDCDEFHSIEADVE